MRYIINRLARASGFAPMQTVETMAESSRKREALQVARGFACEHVGNWMQVRNGRGDVVATFKCVGRSARRV